MPYTYITATVFTCMVRKHHYRWFLEAQGTPTLL